jgi:hypothetical protein
VTTALIPDGEEDGIMSNRILVAISVLIWLLLWPRVGEAAEWRGTEEVQDGVRHLRNPAESILGRAVYEPEELWRLGGFSEADEELFGVVGDVFVGERDNVYILDSQLSEVRVFNIGGEYIRTIGREGEGPGEFRYPIDMLFLPDGTLGVVQPSASRLVLFDAEGSPAGDFHVSPPDGKGFFRLAGARLAGNQLAILYELGSKDKESWITIHRLGFFDMTGTQQGVLIEAGTHMNYAGDRFVERDWNQFNQCWTASPDGRVFARGSFTDYEVRVWAPNGELDRIIHREYPPHHRSREEIDRIEERWNRRFRWHPNLDLEIEEHWSPVHDLYVQGDGRLWVRTSRGWRDRDEGIMAGFDVFDRDGRFVQEVSLRGEFDPENDGLFLEGEYAIVVTDLVSAINSAKGMGGGNEEFAMEEKPKPMTVICYRLPMDRISSESGQETGRSSR